MALWHNQRTIAADIMRLITKELGRVCAKECQKDTRLLIKHKSSNAYRIQAPELFGDLYYYHVPEEILYVKVYETTQSQFDFYLKKNHAPDKES